MNKRLLLTLLLVSLRLVPATIIFDMNGVLSYQDRSTVSYNIGLYVIAQYLVSTASCDLQQMFFNTLDRVPYQAQSTIQSTDDKGNVLPSIMVDFLAGYVSSSEILKMVDSFLQHEPEMSVYEKNIVHAISRALFLPHLFAQATRFYESTISLVKACKDAGHDVYILSNWDKESFDYIHQQHSDILDLFDNIIISGQINLIKPDKAIYEYVLRTYALDPLKTAFIDDQHNNVYTAQKCGIYGICCPSIRHFLYKEPDIDYVCLALNTWLSNIQEPLICA